MNKEQLKGAGQVITLLIEELCAKCGWPIGSDMCCIGKKARNR